LISTIHSLEYSTIWYYIQDPIAECKNRWRPIWLSFL